MSLLKTGFHQSQTTLCLKLQDSVFEGMEIMLTNTGDAYYVQLVAQNASSHEFVASKVKSLKKYLEEQLQVDEDQIEVIAEIASNETDNQVQVDTAGEMLFQNTGMPLTPLWL